ncbi:phenylalanine--tRNA ligase subunit alpha [Ferroacidibacillus organovorans]|uniref:Phenylalanine--tRNA ligase alpha subunit n=1 Tax=Ferroacidibacillus organovorans TaxID=1765683 RepID=A0A853KB53_9BACL|nr:phenylalanine--tRNA ligase subunit alpha [Ferroacidibacillus organovorans]KYP81578.1 phenylalanine--tRNA ligase subunit alpha [Ferroacidibacillus organovorans]OAG94087.1 phenylalanine--tRNA ligase subunit alpha [Ferroacidibacillus organovorans]
MEEKMEAFEARALESLQTVETLEALDAWRVMYLGKKGELANVLRGLSQVDATQRPRMGQLANDVRDRLEHAFGERRSLMEDAEREKREAAEAIDVTLDARTRAIGAPHPLQFVIQKIEDIFVGFGFTVEEGPEVELDYYNFEALNLPKDHPARDMQDTFYLSPDVLLRTHTSPVQARTLLRMENNQPFRIIVPGRVYRRDDDDATHSHAFTQVEGLVVGAGIRMSDLKGMLLSFAREMFGADQDVRLRPSYFPFTEPSAELDVRCIYCGGSGCGTCKHTGWIEILGCGMVHPRVLEMGGYDPQVCTGFAFGMGVERVAMLMYQVEDVRHFYVNDLRLLRQFSGLAR